MVSGGKVGGDAEGKKKEGVVVSRGWWVNNIWSFDVGTQSMTPL